MPLIHEGDGVGGVDGILYGSCDCCAGGGPGSGVCPVNCPTCQDDYFMSVTFLDEDCGECADSEFMLSGNTPLLPCSWGGGCGFPNQHVTGGVDCVSSGEGPDPGVQYWRYNVTCHIPFTSLWVGYVPVGETLCPPEGTYVLTRVGEPGEDDCGDPTVTVHFFEIGNSGDNCT